MNIFKKTLPLAICFVIGVLSFLQYYCPHHLSDEFADVLNDHMNIIYFFAYMLGLISLSMANWGTIKRKADGWGYSVLLFVGMAIGIISGIAAKGEFIANNHMTAYGWMYTYIYSPLQGTMFAILAFYLVSCSYRAFRVKSKEAGLLFLTAGLFILGRIPPGQWLWSQIFGTACGGISGITEWILNCPTLAARRAIMVGISLGSIATSVKIVVGIERQYLGGTD
jgi:hypothetical protein